MLNVFFLRKEKILWLFCNRGSTLWGYRSAYPYSQRKGVSPAPCICPTSAHWIFVAKILGIFQCDDFFEEIHFQAPHKQRFGFCDGSFSVMLRWHLRQHFWETTHVLRSDKQTCSHDLKVSGKKASKYKSAANFSHIKKVLMACEILAWQASHNDKNSEISLYALISNATGLHVQRIQRVEL